jgi:two-component system sensor histidine kinase/response regulator
MTEQTAATAIDLIVVEDSAVDAELALDALRDDNLAVAARQVEDEAAFRAALEDRLPDAILADWTLPHFSGAKALAIARERCPEIPFIFISGTISEASALETLRHGAFDYVFKHELHRLSSILRRALELTRTQRSLIESELRLKLALNAANQGIYDLDLRTGKTIVSDDYVLMLGYEPGDFDASYPAWVQRLNPADRDQVESVFQDCVRGTISDYRIEYRLMNRSGDWVWVLSIGRVVERSADGRGLRLVGTHTDIGDQHKAREFLSFQARRAEAMLSLPDAAGRMNEKEFMQYGQEQAEQLTGSRIAFIHFVNPDQETIELVAWSRATLEHYCQAAVASHYPISAAGIWADALRLRAPVVFNDYASAPNKHAVDIATVRIDFDEAGYLPPRYPKTGEEQLHRPTTRASLSAVEARRRPGDLRRDVGSADRQGRKPTPWKGEFHNSARTAANTSSSPSSRRCASPTDRSRTTWRSRKTSPRRSASAWNSMVTATIWKNW